MYAPGTYLTPQERRRRQAAERRAAHRLAQIPCTEPAAPADAADEPTAPVLGTI